MKQEKKSLQTRWRNFGLAIALSTCFGGFVACDSYDLDEYTPDGWGASIYNYLEEDGHFSNTLRLIDDLGYKEVLAKTGSKTLFAADDDAYARFFANNEWGVHSYEQLSLSQKKLLMLGNMVNSSYQVHDLASVEGPVEGQCIRRLSSLSVFDTVSVVKPNDLPNMQPGDDIHNSTWKKFVGRDSVVLMRDMTVTPMIYFVESALKNYKITNEDYAFLFNGKGREDGDASVNGIKIEKQNIKCSNGFIHKMSEVMLPLRNMAEVIASKPEASVYNKLLERFCAPFYAGDDITEQYNYLYNTDVDSVFEKRFFATKSHGRELNADDDNVVHHEILSYDPGWNTFYLNPIPTADIAVEKDMALMLVPSNEALDNYWNNEEGQVLRDQYETWENVPNDVVIELLRNNQLESFKDGVPSKFDNVRNDAGDPMGLSTDAISDVWLACNGAMYLTKKVYPPTSFVSVLYPAIINESMKIMRWAVEKNGYKVYLNSLNSKFSFFIPTNDALLSYIDPVSYAGSTTYLYKFHYDENSSNPVWASRFKYNMETGEVGDSIDEIRNNDDLLKRKLKEVLDNHIVIGDVEDGNTYYRTKGGQEIKVENVAAGENGMRVSGSLVLGEGKPGIAVNYVYDQTKMGNGKSYILKNTPIMTTRKSVFDVLSEHPEMDKFRELLEGSSLLQDNDEKHAYVSKNINLFNTYHYTVYVPTNAAIQELIDKKELPTWDDVEEAHMLEDTDREEMLTRQIENFLRYHIQDFALFIGAKPLEEEGYETSLINETTGKFERVYSTLSKDNITVKNTLDTKSPRYTEAHVLKTAGLYNIMAREYMLNETTVDINNAGQSLYTSSSAVVHLIDKPLKPAK